MQRVRKIKLSKEWIIVKRYRKHRLKVNHSNYHRHHQALKWLRLNNITDQILHLHRLINNHRCKNKNQMDTLILLVFHYKLKRSIKIIMKICRLKMRNKQIILITREY